MYGNYYKVKENPFQMTSNLNYFYPSIVHNDVLLFLNGIVSGTDRIAMLTGEEGTGKTTVCRSFALNRVEGVRIAIINGPRTDAAGFMQTVDRVMRLKTNSDDPEQLAGILYSFLRRNDNDGKKWLLIVDDAHDLASPVLSQISTLAQWSATMNNRLYILLVGRPELKRKLKDHSLKQLYRRVRMRRNLQPMNRAGTRQYILHRLNVAGSSGKVEFSKRAFHLIHTCSGGVPRCINKICDETLMTAYGQNIKRITTSRIIKTIWRLAGRSKNPLLKLLVIHKPALLWALTGCVVLSILLIDTPEGIGPGIGPVAVEHKQAHAFFPVSQPEEVLTFVYPSEKTAGADVVNHPIQPPKTTPKALPKSLPKTQIDATPSISSVKVTKAPAAQQPLRPIEAKPAVVRQTAPSKSPEKKVDTVVSQSLHDGSETVFPELRINKSTQIGMDEIRLVRSPARPMTITRPDDSISNRANADPMTDKPSTKDRQQLLKDFKIHLKSTDTRPELLKLRARSGKPPAKHTSIVWPEKANDPWKVKPSNAYKTKTSRHKKSPQLIVGQIESEQNMLTKARFLDYLTQIDLKTNRRDTMLYTIRLWKPSASIAKGLDKIGNDLEYFNESAQNNGLAVRSDMMTFEQLKTGNLPAILEVYHPRQVNPKYLVIKKSDTREAVVCKGRVGSEVLVSLDHLDQFWSGVCHTILRK